MTPPEKPKRTPSEVPKSGVRPVDRRSDDEGELSLEKNLEWIKRKGRIESGEEPTTLEDNLEWAKSEQLKKASEAPPANEKAEIDVGVEDDDGLEANLEWAKKNLEDAYKDDGNKAA